VAPDGRQRREVDGRGRTVRELLGGRKYSIDFYQREYKWHTKQVTELLDDLSATFLDSYQPGDDRSAVADYGHYFLGSIILSDKDGQKFIIDGQQRLTTLTLLLIFLQRELANSDQRAQLAELIFSQRFGSRSFNLDVPERNACMEALYTGHTPVLTDPPESIENILARYTDLEEHFPDELRGDALPYFADWMIENVHMVEITAYSDSDAYTIFETMNDRGLSLTPTDMLKGYLLARIHDARSRVSAGDIWRKHIAALKELSRDEDADGIKAWLRSQYAETIRERKRGALPQDFDRIGTEFHRWVRDQETSLGLRNSDDFAAFISRDFGFYAHWYKHLREAGENLRPGFDSIYFNAQSNFTLQYPVLLSPLTIDDSEEDIERKVRVTAAFLDILLYRRIWNFRAIDYNTMQYTMFLLLRDIRRKEAHSLAEILRHRLEQESETFSTNPTFRLHGTNRRQIHRILARMTHYLEIQSGLAAHYEDLARMGGKSALEIEHIWADHFEQHEDDFSHPSEFGEYRNRIGGLLLLPRSFNASYGDLPYEEKLIHYDAQNLLARSLHPNAYHHNPGFLQFVERSGLAFKPHPRFRKSDLDDRQELYQCLAELIWNPDRLEEELEAPQRRRLAMEVG
jgi:hypothetical protein